MGTLWTPILNQPVQWDYIDKRGIAQLVGGIFHVELFFFRLLPQVVIGLVAFGPWYCLTAAIYSFGFQGVGVDICYYCKNWYTPKIMHHFRLGPHIPLNPIAIASPRKSALSSPFVCWLHPHFHTNHPIKNLLKTHRNHVCWLSHGGVEPIKPPFFLVLFQETLATAMVPHLPQLARGRHSHHTVLPVLQLLPEVWNSRASLVVPWGFKAGLTIKNADF